MAPAPPAYFVAGPADDEDFAKAEHLAELLMSSVEGVRCTIIPVLPENWQPYIDKLHAQLGCQPRQPLIWTSTGKAIGGIFEFETAVDTKYGVRVPETKLETWKQIAAANVAALRKKQAAEPPVLPVDTDGARGEAVSTALLQGYERYLEGKKGGCPFDGKAVVATVLTLGPLLTPPHEVPTTASRPPPPATRHHLACHHLPSRGRSRAAL